MKPPTCEELCDGVDVESVSRTADDSWRHGSYVTQIFHRAEDNTYWEAQYRVSTDGETNELREGIATIVEVEPYKVTVTAYRPKASTGAGAMP